MVFAEDWFEIFTELRDSDSQLRLFKRCAISGKSDAIRQQRYKQAMLCHVFIPSRARSCLLAG
jgi:hypothetical protein